jgi:hypothetical protein
MSVLPSQLVSQTPRDGVPIWKVLLAVLVGLVIYLFRAITLLAWFIIVGPLKLIINAVVRTHAKQRSCPHY